MKLLIVIEGNAPSKPDSRLLHKADKIYLLYLSPRVKALQYKAELNRDIKGKVEINLVNPKALVDFDYSRKILLDFIASLPEKLKIGASTLTEYMNIQGLNMWWTSGIVEATSYKRNIFQNFYYLSAVQHVLEKFGVDTAWFQVEDASLAKDISSMFDRRGVKYYQGCQARQYAGIISTVKRWVQFVTVLTYWILFKLICPAWVKSQKRESRENHIHVFYSMYPHNWSFKDGVSEHKIYKDLPSVLSKQLGGESYFLSWLSLRSILHPFQLVTDVGKIWGQHIRFIPMSIFLSLSDIMSIFLSPVRRWKYFRLKKVREYRELFKLGNTDMFHTFDQAMRDSLLGSEVVDNLLHFNAFLRFARLYGERIFQVVYYLEFHNWEVALISGVREGDSSIPIVGLQQATPTPVTLQFFFSPNTSKGAGNSYPLPDLVLCSCKLYEKLMHSKGIEPERVDVIGFIGGQYLNQPMIPSELKRKKIEELGLPSYKKICLVACSINLSLTEGVIYLLKQIAARIPEVLFVLKAHADTAVQPMLRKYGIKQLENVKSVDCAISGLLPLSDYVLSVGTSVSQEAMQLGLPQVNLDVGGLPRDNPLHIMPGFIDDVETPDELLDFFLHTEKFRTPKDDDFLFMGDMDMAPCQKILNILVARFHKDSSPQLDRQLGSHSMRIDKTNKGGM